MVKELLREIQKHIVNQRATERPRSTQNQFTVENQKTKQKSRLLQKLEDYTQNQKSTHRTRRLHTDNQKTKQGEIERQRSKERADSNMIWKVQREEKLEVKILVMGEEQERKGELAEVMNLQIKDE